jgi:uncharacterized protein (TIGR02996 family)
MSERAAFFRALAADEDDAATRLVYSDWLEENGEPEEADRQRRWPAAKAWLVALARENNPYPEEETSIDYEDLIERGRDAVAALDDMDDTGDTGFDARTRTLFMSCGNNMSMCDALRKHREEFWRNWSIVTGIPVPAAQAEEGRFGCGC